MYLDLWTITIYLTITPFGIFSESKKKYVDINQPFLYQLKKYLKFNELEQTKEVYIMPY